MEDVAEKDVLGSAEEAARAYAEAIQSLAKCAEVPMDPYLGMEQYERWRSFWGWTLASKRLDDDPPVLTQQLLEDLAESFGPHAERFGIIKDYGFTKTKLLHNLTVGALEALKAGNRTRAKFLIKRAADIQYWLAVARIHQSQP